MVSSKDRIYLEKEDLEEDLKNSVEYQTAQVVKLWEPLESIVSPQELLGEDPFSLFTHLYNLAQEKYKTYPPRKDGHESFVHPLTVIYFLNQAKANYLTLCTGLMHDFIEEEVDMYKEEKSIPDTTVTGVYRLDGHEEIIVKKLEKAIMDFCQEKNLNPNIAQNIINPVRLLTRHKKHLYYRSISEIFNCPDEAVKERAIQVKLADRMHNILTISIFEEEAKMYECFKNLFILNNTRKYLMDQKKLSNTDILYPSSENTTEKLHIKCCKATYKAFSTICDLSLAKGIQDVKTDLELNFKKFSHKSSGLVEVTEIKEEEHHPMRNYNGIIRKYDAKLHKDMDEFWRRKNIEVDYYKRYYADKNFSPQQIEAIIDYKDAYALGEIVGELYSNHHFFIRKFGCLDLCERGRKCLMG